MWEVKLETWILEASRRLTKLTFYGIFIYHISLCVCSIRETCLWDLLKIRMCHFSKTRCITWTDNMFWPGEHYGLGGVLFMSLRICHLWGNTIFGSIIIIKVIYICHQWDPSNILRQIKSNNFCHGDYIMTVASIWPPKVQWLYILQ